MESTPGSRLRHLRELLGFAGQQQEFADRIGLTQQSVSNMERDKTEPAAKSLNKIYAAFPQVNISWLVTGAGQPLDTMRDGRTLTPTEERPQPDPPTDEARMPATVQRRMLVPVMEEMEGGRVIDYTSRYITSLERQVDYLLNEVDRLKPLPAPDAAWLPVPRPEISLRPTACTIEPEARQGGKVIMMWQKQQVEQEAEAA